jgi:hypothetical protein
VEISDELTETTIISMTCLLCNVKEKRGKKDRRWHGDSATTVSTFALDGGELSVSRPGHCLSQEVAPST